MERLDAHCHFWSLSRGDYGWLSNGPAALDPIRRDFVPNELASLTGSSQVIAVQAAPTDAETDYLLDLAAKNQMIVGVVGWVDLSTANAAPRIESIAADRRLRGIRPMLQDIADDDWINSVARGDAIMALIDQDLCFDALVLPRQLLPVATFANRWPELPIVVDHAAKPRLARGGPDEVWQSGMKRLAADPRIHCKMSGLLTEMAPAQRATPETALSTLRPVINNLLDWFGPNRLLWGSDWPVLTLAASHADWRDLSDQLLEGLSQSERDAVFGGNARRFYKVETP